MPRTFVFSIFLFASSATMMLASRYKNGGGGAGMAGRHRDPGTIFMFGQASGYIGLYASGVTANSSLFATTFFL